MEVTVEISYYPMTYNYQKLIEEFIISLKNDKRIKIEQGTMSSILTGSYENVMELLYNSLKPFIKMYPSVFTLKISNACEECKNPVNYK